MEENKVVDKILIGAAIYGGVIGGVVAWKFAFGLTKPQPEMITISIFHVQIVSLIGVITGAFFGRRAAKRFTKDDIEIIRSIGQGFKAGIISGSITGTFVFPVIGTFIGFFIGAITGMLAGLLAGLVITAILHQTEK